MVLGEGRQLVADDVGAVDDLGQAPVQDDHLAEVAQDDVLPLQVAVDHPPRVGVRQRVADADEGVEQRDEVERGRRPGGAGPCGSRGSPR